MHNDKIQIAEFTYKQVVDFGVYLTGHLPVDVAIMLNEFLESREEVYEQEGR
jgi:hypothetical protein